MAQQLGRRCTGRPHLILDKAVSSEAASTKFNQIHGDLPSAAVRERGNSLMKKLLIGLFGTAFASPALATGITVKPLLDLRLRWENVDQDGIAKDANALTLRARTGAEVTMGDFRLLGEAESTMPFVEHYFSGLNGKTQFPLVADPGNFELNRFQLQYRGVKNLALRRLGRLAAERADFRRGAHRIW